MATVEFSDAEQHPPKNAHARELSQPDQTAVSAVHDLTPATSASPRPAPLVSYG